MPELVNPQTRKNRKRDARKVRVGERERLWVQRYQRVQGAALGDPYYRLPAAAPAASTARRKT